MRRGVAARGERRRWRGGLLVFWFDGRHRFVVRIFGQLFLRGILRRLNGVVGEHGIVGKLLGIVDGLFVGLLLRQRA
jgi:hypothetical protein